MRLVTRLPLTALLLSSVALIPVSASADSGSDARFVSATNSARSSHGLRGYAVSGDLTAVARRWAAHMAARHQLAHNPSFGSQVCCWTQLGENVGVGGTVSQIQRAFMASPEHRANILSSACTQVGIGTARGSDGRLYVDELFRRPTHTAPRAAPHRSATVVSHPALRAVHRVSRGMVRRVRLAVPHRRLAQLHIAVLLAAAHRESAGGYADPVGGAVAYVRVVRAMAGSAGG
jgi:hypothetical protein